MSKRLPFSIDDIKRSLTHGSIDKAILYNLRGFNHGTTNTYLPKARTLQGMCFWVRPQLNLTTGNIRTNRILTPLINADTMSIPTYIRHMLDPRLDKGYSMPDSAGTVAPNADPDYNITGGAITGGRSPASNQTFLDNKQAFIPIMTNSVSTLSGWPDIAVKTYSDKPGAYNQAHTMVDGLSENNGQIDITASFRNSSGETILNMIHMWTIYMGLVFSGKVVPYPDFIANNELDYQTRIFRILFDKSGKYVAKIAATGPGIPLAIGIGAGFDFNESTAFNEQNESVEVRFKFHGVEYQDPILMMEFNAVVVMFNNAMESKSGMVQIPYGLRKYFNHTGYPWINTATGEFQIWAEAAIVEEIIGRLLNTGLAPEITAMHNAHTAA